MEIATAASQDGAWEHAVHELTRLGHGEEYVELSADDVERICRSPAFRGGAAMRTAATVQPARLAFGLRGVLLDRGVRIFEDSPATGLQETGDGVVAQTAGGSVTARAAVLAVNSRTREWKAFRSELSVASSHMVVTEPVPDVLEELGWTGGELLCDLRRMLHYFRTTDRKSVV